MTTTRRMTTMDGQENQGEQGGTRVFEELKQEQVFSLSTKVQDLEAQNAMQRDNIHHLRCELTSAHVNMRKLEREHSNLSEAYDCLKGSYEELYHEGAKQRAELSHQVNEGAKQRGDLAHQVNILRAFLDPAVTKNAMALTKGLQEAEEYIRKLRGYLQGKQLTRFTVTDASQWTPEETALFRKSGERPATPTVAEIYAGRALSPNDLEAIRQGAAARGGVAVGGGGRGISPGKYGMAGGSGNGSDR